MIGDLYVVATPIGHLDDLSTRALTILQQVDAIACEDTRHSQRLLQAYGINASLIALHQHNERSSGGHVINKLLAGENIALISDAGTPLVSDPGAILITLAHENGVRVIPIPGASSVMTALSASGLDASQFIFAGFIPAKTNERQRFLLEYEYEARTTVFFETPHRIRATIVAMQALYAGERELVIARELTKQFEEIARMPLTESLAWLDSDDYRQKGEFVLLLAGAEKAVAQTAQWQAMANDFSAHGLSAKSTSTLVANYAGVKKKIVYQYLIDAKINEKG